MSEQRDGKIELSSIGSGYFAASQMTNNDFHKANETSQSNSQEPQTKYLTNFASEIDVKQEKDDDSNILENSAKKLA